MVKIGELLELRIAEDKLQIELTPSFHNVICKYIGKVPGHIPAFYLDHRDFIETTEFTESLKVALISILKVLVKGGILTDILEYGFGFGKSHFLILLYHLLNNPTDEKVKQVLEDLAKISREFRYDQLLDVLKNTLVIGIDFQILENVVDYVIKQLEIQANYIWKSQEFIDVITTLINEIKSSQSSSLDRIRELILKFLNLMYQKGIKPNIVILIDELGIGILKRLKEFKEKDHISRVYEAHSLITFISDLTTEVSNLASTLRLSFISIIALAEQDITRLESEMKLFEDERIREKYESIYNLIKAELYGRFKRPHGGISMIKPSYKIEEQIGIILKKLTRFDIEKLMTKKIYAQYVLNIFRQLGLNIDVSKVERYYPFSIDVEQLLVKLTRSSDLPETEYTRSILNIAYKIISNALSESPEDEVLSLKHLSFKDLAYTLVGFLRDSKNIWVSKVVEIEKSLDEIKGVYDRKYVEYVVKVLFLHSISENILSLLTSPSSYACTNSTLQAYSLIAFNWDTQLVGTLPTILNELINRGIVSKTVLQSESVGEDAYYVSVLPTLRSYLIKRIEEERAKVYDGDRLNIGKALFYIAREGYIPHIFRDYRFGNSKILGALGNTVIQLCRYDNMRDILLEDKIGDFRVESARILIPEFWDFETYRFLSSGEVEKKICSMIERLKDYIKPSKFHTLIVVPSLGILNKLIDLVVRYQACTKFINEDLVSIDKLIENTVEEYAGYVESVVRRRIFTDHDKAVLKNWLRQQAEHEKNYVLEEQSKLAREIVKHLIAMFNRACKVFLDNQCHCIDILESSEILEVGKEIDFRFGRERDVINIASLIISSWARTIIKKCGFEQDNNKFKEAFIKYLEHHYCTIDKTIEMSLDEVEIPLFTGGIGVLPLNLYLVRETLNEVKRERIYCPDKSILETQIDFGNRRFRIRKLRRASKEEVTKLIEERVKEVIPTEVYSESLIPLNVEDIVKEFEKKDLIIDKDDLKKVLSELHDREFVKGSVEVQILTSPEDLKLVAKVRPVIAYEKVNVIKLLNISRDRLECIERKLREGGFEIDKLIILFNKDQDFIVTAEAHPQYISKAKQLLTPLSRVFQDFDKFTSYVKIHFKYEYSREKIEKEFKECGEVEVQFT